MRTRKRSRLALASDAGNRLVLAAPGAVSGDDERRVIEGLVVPFGRAGHTSGGRLQFGPGRLNVSSASRVKLLHEHDQHRPVGVGASFDDVDAAEADRRLVELGREPMGLGGVWGRFDVPEGPDGDQALANARNGLRDAFSVGVQLDDATMTKLRRAQGAPVEAGGDLREVSLVSVPAFDDARVAAAAAGDLVVSAWSTTTTETTSAAGAGTTNREGNTMTEAQRRRLAQLLAQASLTDAETTERDELQQLATAHGITITPETPAAATGGQAQASTPSVVPAVAGQAFVQAEPSTYTFSGGESLVRDLWNANMRRDSEAGERVERFNAELVDGNPTSLGAFAQAAATRDTVNDGQPMPSFFGPNPNRPDLMRQLVDVKRPFISRLDRIPISNAQPFSIPAVGEFTGVGAHTEGTPHRPAGTLTLSGDTLTPSATSGAYEVSRELVDAFNPALDRIAARAMLRDYQRQSEGKITALLAAYAATEGSTVYGVADTMQLRGALLDFVNDDEEAADIAAVSKSLLKRLGLDTDDVSRPQLPFVSPSNTLGTMKAGATGFSIDGVDLFRAARLDGSVGADTGVLARSEGILWAESNVLQFRFDEVLGPGVIKLALWAYSGAAILDTADVQIINAGVDPTP